MKSILRHLKRLFPAFMLAVAAGLGMLAAGPVRAQSAEVDPPGRVARVAETFGQVWLYSPDTGEWISAVRNRPVTSGDRLATDAGGRVELNLGSTTLRLDSNSEIEVRRLDDRQVSLHLHNGSATLRVRDAQAVGDFEMTTEEGRLRVQTAGRYRFDRFDRSTHLTVYSGQAYYEGPGSALTVDAGQRAQFWLEPNGAAQYSITEPVRDAFAGWNNERDRNADRLASARFVSPEMTGAQDLDRYGRWEQSPDYGAIWFPRTVVSGWAPYSTGHWAWVRPWGWTWVDDAPWGFAPFHYGRWVYYRNAWCWAPGTFVRRPVYAPALVAWVGGSRVNVSVSIGGGPAVGWFPLAPREVYVPAYYASPRYVRDINVTHVTNVTYITNVINDPNGAQRDYANRKYPHAMTVVPASVLTNREPVAPSAARLRDLPPVRALVTEPARVAAMLAPPVAIAPPAAQRGLEARPFRQPGEGAPGGRNSRPPMNATEEVRRGPAERAQIGRPPLSATEEVQHGSSSGLPPGRAVADERRGRDRRDAGVDPRPSSPPAAAVLGVPPRPAPVVAPAVVAPPPLPAVAPSVRPIPPAPVQVRSMPAQIARPPMSATEEVRQGPPSAAPPQPGFNEERRGRDRHDAAPMPRPAPRPEAVPNIVPPQPRVAVPPPPQVVPRPGRVEPPPGRVEPPPGLATRPAEAPRPNSASEEARTSEQRGHGRPGGPPGRDDRN